MSSFAVEGFIGVDFAGDGDYGAVCVAERRGDRIHIRELNAVRPTRFVMVHFNGRQAIFRAAAIAEAGVSSGENICWETMANIMVIDSEMHEAEVAAARIALRLLRLKNRKFGEGEDERRCIFAGSIS